MARSPLLRNWGLRRGALDAVTGRFGRVVARDDPRVDLPGAEAASPTETQRGGASPPGGGGEEHGKAGHL